MAEWFFLVVAIVLDTTGAFHVTGWNPSSASPADYPQIFSVRVAAAPADAPAMGGTYAVEKGELVFHPKYPLQEGVEYRATFRAPGEPTVVEPFQVKRAPPDLTDPAATRVEAIFPSAKELPENVLKFYIQFSRPMSRGEAYTHIHLLETDTGIAVAPPFLEIPEELWDPEAKRFTLLFEPGRIKRGLVPNREAGPPVVAGKRYTLVIDAEWRDAKDHPLAAEYRRTFKVGPAERRPIELHTWKLVEPGTATVNPLIVTFPRPLDRALLEHMIAVVGPDGKSLDGDVRVGPEEMRWEFRPRAAWKPGIYKLRVETALEDIAGNKVDRPFDVDVFEHIDKTIRTETQSLTFIIVK